MAEGKQAGVIFLDRSKLDVYIDGAESIITFTLPQNLVRDLEVLNKDQLISQIATFIQANTIYQAHIVILLGENILFQKDIQNADMVPQPEEQDKEVKKFLETVPFENVSSKAYPIQQGMKVIATNTDLYDVVRRAFENTGSTIDAVIPATLLSDQFAAINGLNSELITAIFANAEAIKNQSLISPEEEALKIKQIEEQKNAPLSLQGKNGRAIIMSGFLAILLIIFIILLILVNPFGTYKQRSQPTTLNTTQTIPPTATPIPAPVGAIVNTTATTAANASDVKVTRIHIINTTSSPALGLLLRSKFVENGFATVDISNETQTTPAKTLVVFNTKVPQTTRDTITSVVKNIFTTFSVQENTNPQTDVVITIAPTP